MDDEIFLNERVEVLASFGGGLNPCCPLKFRRPNRREITVSEIGLRHPSAKGDRLRHIFDVTDGSADYRLEFDAERLTWYMTREAEHGDV